MPEVKKHPQGEPCWAELATSDEKGALKFYSGLFGWKDEAQSMGPDMGMYHMQKLGKLTAAALYKMGPQEKGFPPHWRLYFAVDSADATAKKIKSAGGKVVMEPMEVMDAGRMVAAQDPSGAYVSFWQAGKHIGTTVSNEPGAPIWGELMARGVKKALPFYKAVLGVEVAPAPMSGIDYNLFKLGGTDVTGVAGAMEMPKEVPAMVPSYWNVYFQVTNCDASVKKATTLGGKVFVPAMDIPNVGRFAALSDPQGASFSILQPAQM